MRYGLVLFIACSLCTPVLSQKLAWMPIHFQPAEAEKQATVAPNTNDNKEAAQELGNNKLNLQGQAGEAVAEPALNADAGVKRSMLRGEASQPNNDNNNNNENKDDTLTQLAPNWEELGVFSPAEVEFWSGRVVLCAMAASDSRSGPAAFMLPRVAIQRGCILRDGKLPEMGWNDSNYDRAASGEGQAAVMRPLWTLLRDFQRGGGAVSVAPSGFIHHESRCGSSLLANTLAAASLHTAYVVFEPAASSIFIWASFQKMSAEAQVRATRVIWSSYGALLDTDTRLRSYFIKTTPQTVYFIDVMQQSFAQATWLYLFRSVTEVLVSNLAPAAHHLNGNSPSHDHVTRTSMKLMNVPCARVLWDIADRRPEITPVLAKLGKSEIDDSILPEDFCAASVETWRDAALAAFMKERQTSRWAEPLGQIVAFEDVKNRTMDVIRYHIISALPIELQKPFLSPQAELAVKEEKEKYSKRNEKYGIEQIPQEPGGPPRSPSFKSDSLEKQKRAWPVLLAAVAKYAPSDDKMRAIAQQFPLRARPSKSSGLYGAAAAIAVLLIAFAFMGRKRFWNNLLKSTRPYEAHLL